ncbi:hypothetical protein AC622_10980 [Bacillus sp. FJAT-27916]|uniref:hypothetical protein n=1 Tax=Bacillus sp. FJAT-27916 TaxID=1679169 RepID=UPI0006709F24|nr:hypothetical protein [Bacillus sp. FJAT-27916]KMY44702.1 hypothetical protein AC622_10980 [Bacillus sp. FJAT-27916]
MEYNKQTIDRATRLAVSLTVAGGAVFIVNKTFNAWHKTFSTDLYTNNIFNFDYVFSSILFFMSILFAYTIGRYLFLELKTFNHFEDEAKKQFAYENSDKAYSNIFLKLKRYSIWSLGIILIILIPINISKTSFSWNYVIGFFLIGSALFIFGLLFLNKENIKKFTKRKKIIGIIKVTNKLPLKFKKSLISLFEFLYGLALIFYLGLFITMSSFQDNQLAKIDIGNSVTIPINIVVNNNIDTEIRIKISNSKTEHYINHSDMKILESSIEVYEKNEVLKSNDIEHFTKNLISENDKLSIPNTEYTKKYSIDSDKYIIDGNNKVEISIVTTGTDNTRAIQFVTSIKKEGDRIEIAKDKINVKF